MSGHLLKSRKKSASANHGDTMLNSMGSGAIEPVDAELQSARTLFGEKVKELSAAVAKVDALTHQLEELRKGNTSNSYHVSSGGNTSSVRFNQEFEKLRQELLHRSRLVQSQHSDLESKKSLLNQKKSELVVIDEKIAQLQQRLAKKRHINQQLSYQMQSQTINPMNGPLGLCNQFNTLRGTSGHSYKRIPIQRSAIPNIAAVEPIQRQQPPSTMEHREVKSQNELLFMYSKPDSKYQTLPPNTKFSKNGFLNENCSRDQAGLRLLMKDVPDEGHDRDSSPSDKSVTPIIDSNGSEDSSLRIICSESGVGSSISSASSFQSGNINLTNKEESRLLIDRFKSGDERVLVKGTPSTLTFNSLINDSIHQRLHPLTSTCNSSLKPTDGSSTVSSDSSPPSAVNNDWQKSRRRPVVVDEDMERQLSAPACDSIELTREHFPVETARHKSAPTTCQDSSSALVKSQSGSLGVTKASQVVTASQERKPDVTDDSCSRNEKVPDVEKVLVIEKTIESGTVKIIPSENHDLKVPNCSPNDTEPSNGSLCRQKSGLRHQKDNQSGQLVRRVSFDPLALLLDAALEGELELVKKTASQVPDPSAVKDEGITALHNAICAGHFPIVRFLVEIACDVNAQDSDGWTPLHCAASCNNLKMVQLLVENGACIFATTFSDHETAAEKCEEDELGYEECFQYLSGVQEKMGLANGGVVYAVYNYDAQNHDEISFKDGEEVTILRRGDDQEIDWWWAKSKDGREGYVPRNLFGLYPRVKARRQPESELSDN